MTLLPCYNWAGDQLEAPLMETPLDGTAALTMEACVRDPSDSLLPDGVA